MLTTSPAQLHRRAASAEGAAARGAARLVLRTVRRGAETVSIADRRVRIDADVYVVGEAPFGSALAAEADTDPLLVEVAVPEGATVHRTGFIAATRSTSGPVGRAIAATASFRSGARKLQLDGDAAASVWNGLLEEEHVLQARAARIACVKPGTRDALFRRLLLSADFLQSHFAEPIKVGRVAAVANLSPFHFARLFARVMDETPHAFLVRKRLAVARRLLAAGIGCGEVAERAGFGCRSTLFRHLKDAASRPS